MHICIYKHTHTHINTHTHIYAYLPSFSDLLPIQVTIGCLVELPVLYSMFSLVT